MNEFFRKFCRKISDNILKLCVVKLDAMKNRLSLIPKIW